MNVPIAITQRVLRAEGYDEPRDALAHDWAVYLEPLGLRPILVPNRVSDPGEFLVACGVAGVILSNGNDVGEWEGGGPPDPPGSPEGWRDLTEHKILEAAALRRLPVLGVCRGLQMMNRHFGGGLCRHLASEGHSGHVACEHAVRVESDSIRELLGADRVTVNSFHNQGIRKRELASCLQAFAVSEDGVVEGLFHDTLPFMAIQWHPERPPLRASYNDALIRKALRL